MNKLSPIFVIALIAGATANCLLKQSAKQTSLCLIEENPANEEFLQKLCKDATVSSTLSIVAEYKSSFETFRNLGHYCSAGRVGRLNWIKYSLISEKLLNSKAVNMELPRVARTFINGEVKLTTDSTGDDIEILIEKLPIRYELSDVERTKWKNVTELQTVTISKEHLKNSQTKSQIMIKEVPYLSNNSMEYIFPENIARNREVRIFKDDKIFRVNTFTNPPAVIQHSAFKIERRVGPNSVLDLRVIAVQSATLYEISGTLNSVYDDEVREERSLNLKVIERGLTDVHAEELLPSQMLGRFSEGYSVDQKEGTSGWDIWIILAVCIFFGTVIIAATDVSIKLIRARRAKALGHTKTKSVY